MDLSKGRKKEQGVDTCRWSLAIRGTSKEAPRSTTHPPFLKDRSCHCIHLTRWKRQNRNLSEHSGNWIIGVVNANEMLMSSSLGTDPSYYGETLWGCQTCGGGEWPHAVGGCLHVLQSPYLLLQHHLVLLFHNPYSLPVIDPSPILLWSNADPNPHNSSWQWVQTRFRL